MSFRASKCNTLQNALIIHSSSIGYKGYNVFPLTFNDVIDQGVKHACLLGELHLQTRHQVNLSTSNPLGNVLTGAALVSTGSTNRQSTT